MTSMRLLTPGPVEEHSPEDKLFSTDDVTEIEAVTSSKKIMHNSGVTI